MKKALVFLILLTPIVVIFYNYIFWVEQVRMNYPAGLTVISALKKKR